MDGVDIKQDGVLTAQLLKSTSNEFDIESIHTLELTKLRLSNIAVIGKSSKYAHMCMYILVLLHCTTSANASYH